MSNTKEYDKNNRLIRTIYSGNIKLEDVLAGMKETIDSNENSQFEKVLADFRDCTLSLSREDIIHAAEKLGEAEKYPPTLAILVKDPKNTAFAMLFEMLATKTHICKVFSTEEAAYTWLDVKF